MKFTQHEGEHEVTLTPRDPATASVILLHGLGADGWDFVPMVVELGLPDSMAVRFVFPHAPERPVTVNNGFEMRAWYDIVSFTPAGRADAAGLAEASHRVGRYLQAECDAGIPSSRIVLAGFSQGGAVALHAGLRHPERLAGILAMSTYLAQPSTLAAERSTANADVPIFMAHGTADPIVHLKMGLESRDALRAAGYAVEWKEYPMQHGVCEQEIADVGRWLRETLA